ncbi:camp-mediated signaling protein Sok [Clathrospora elynae]|uniref:Camp-mediated signaling protein Sok n=1 Tax=Clathrospora elynae TaxID=706981 RepID=A0A6A5SK06_9PLEO|nr:camp-mediated signaling protein Sok [Clathrospora elynae]
MGTQPPKAAGSTASSFRPDHGYPARSNAMDVDHSDASASTWHAPLICSEEPTVEDRHSTEQGMRSHTSDEVASRDACPPQPIPPPYQNIPEELAGLLITMIPVKEGLKASGAELADAYLEASDAPPVTKQSLSELDIQNIITNIKLRHDVNFDRNLSFRPNTEGPKGQEKERAAQKYWIALEAELVLYNRLFQGTPPIHFSQAKLEAFTHHAERRIPKLFQTVRDVLKSLVPDRDHLRIDEHLDIPMLMQAIERGVCDLVRLAEWLAQLLKEHCAPMRDVFVDEMVASTREGVAGHSLEKIVDGLRGLFGILEAMKLDVANHQIRNLKTLLIEDTVNFEKHYHLDRLVNSRSRISINTAQNWFADATKEFGPHCSQRSRDAQRFRLEVLTRSVVAISFGRDGRSDFPETFFLDQDRLRMLKAEINDLVMFEVCMHMFVELARQFGYDGPISLALGQQVRVSLLAIMGEAVGHGPQQWMMNSEALSLEVLRQASCLAGQAPAHHFDRLADADQHLRNKFIETSARHAAHLEASLLPQILANVDRHSASSPMDLFTSLVSLSPSMPPLPTYPSQPCVADTFSFAHLNPETAKLTDLANRITHIILLHWRVWGPIAYVQEDYSQCSSSASDATPSPSPMPQTQSRQPLSSLEQEAHVPASMRTGEPHEAGQETHITHHTLPR